MTNRIEPALSADRSAVRIVVDPNGNIGIIDGWGDAATAPPADVIRAANAALPPDDPRKITREQVHALMLTLLNEPSAFGQGCGMVHRLADALSSYLPPEEP